jgi:hypothetical protein
MRPDITHKFSKPASPELPGNSAFDNLSRIEQDLNDLVRALGLLGVKRCSQCRQFVRSSETGELFDCGQLVCYQCIPSWWSNVSQQLEIAERERVEGKLASWLRKHHRAEVVKETSGEGLDMGNVDFQMVAKCLECAGSGKLMQGERCRFCNGAGTVRIMVPH